MKLFRFFLAMVVMMTLLSSCHSGNGNEEGAIDLPAIQQKGELTVLTLNSSTSYFSYRGEPMGFQYELAQQFAASLGVKLNIKVVKNVKAMTDSLLAGKGDLIAFNLTISNALKDSVIYCGEENITHQVLVQRKSKSAITDVTQLIGKEVYATPGAHLARLRNLNDELGGGINVKEISADSVSVEELISWVADGKIDYTLANEEVAKLNRTYYPNLNVSLPVSFDQRSSWAVRKTSPLLAQAADKWHKENINSPEFKISAKRYFELNKHPHSAAILSVKDGKISHYDHLFRKYAPRVGWDWRLLASLCFAESNFNPDVVSWAGAKGLMQLMPATCRAMGIPSGKEKDPEESIRAGVEYIARLQSIFKRVPEAEERTKFVLAAYNAGVGHITDAMALAEKYGRNRYRWEHHVDHYVLLKSNEEYYQDPVCKNGYFRGTETYNFVRDVLRRAEIYKKKIHK